MKAIRNDSNFDAIQAYMRAEGATELSKYQKELLERWTTAHAQMLDLVSDRDIAEVLKNRFGIAETTAYRDLSNTRKLFGEANALDKNHCLSLTWQLCIEELRRARTAKDTKTVGSILKTMAAIGQSLSANGQDLAVMFNQYNIQIVANPAEAGLDPVDIVEVENLIKEIDRERGKRLD